MDIGVIVIRTSVTHPGMVLTEHSTRRYVCTHARTHTHHAPVQMSVTYVYYNRTCTNIVYTMGTVVCLHAKTNGGMEVEFHLFLNTVMDRECGLHHSWAALRPRKESALTTE
jgi:hypothetical protein